MMSLIYFSDSRWLQGLSELWGGGTLWSVLYGLFYKSFYLFPFIKLMSLGDVHIFILRHIQGVVMAVSVINLTELISKD